MTDIPSTQNADDFELTEFEQQILDMETDQVADFVRNHPEKSTLRISELWKSVLTTDNEDAEKQHGNVIVAMENYLRNPSFYGKTIFEIAIPSGKIIASDSLFDYIRDIDFQEDSHDGIGRDQYSRQLAQERNMIYMPVGNSCPSITIQQETGTIHVTSPEWDEVNDEPSYRDGEKPVAIIDTDLWAVSMMDYDNWLALGGADIVNSPELGDEMGYSVFEVIPGQYRVTIHSNNEKFDYYDDLAEFATIELVQQSDSVVAS